MQVSIEKVSNVEHRLTITVPAERFETAYTNRIKELARKAKVKGFRPGKAPQSVIQQQFGDEARKYALSEIIQETLHEAITEHKLRPISAPQVEPKSIMAGQPLEFIATIEVLPDISNIACRAVEIEKPVVTVTDEDINRVIEQLRKQYTKWQKVDRAAQENDRVVIDYYAIFDGKSDIDNKVEGFQIELGSHTMLPGFETGLIGAKAGDRPTLTLSFPKDFSVEEKAGKPIEFVVTVKQVFEADMPRLDEAFIKRLAVKSGQMEDLKTQIKQSLEQDRDRLIQEKLKEQIFTKLLEQNPLEVPKSLVQREAKHIHDEMYPPQQAHHHDSHSPDELTSFNELAKKRVALSLLLDSYAKQADLNADKERVKRRIQEIASLYEKPQEVVEWLSSGERLAGIESQVMEDQVLAKLMEGLKVAEKNMSYAELKNIRL